MRTLLAPLLMAAALAAACASYDGRGLRSGASGEGVKTLMGAPAAVYPGPGGTQRWAYPRGPAGLQTYMARIDASGRLLGIDQVLDPAVFAQLRIGQDRQSDVHALLGPHWMSSYFERRKELVWTWRFRNAWGNPAQLHVTFDEAGVVKRYEQIEEDRERRRWDID